MPTIDIEFSRAQSTIIPSGGALTQAVVIPAVNFVTGRDYLILGRCSMQFNSNYMKMTMRRTLTEAYPGHTVEQTANRAGNGVEEFFGMSKWTADGTNNWNIAAANYGGSSVNLIEASLLALDLTTFGSSNYWWNENTTLMSAMDNNYATHVGAQVTWTADGTSTYLIIGSADGEHSGNDGLYFRSMLYDSTLGGYLNDPVVRPGAIGDFGTYKCNSHMFVVTPSAGSHTVELRFGGDSAWNHHRSNLIVIRLDRFVLWNANASRPNNYTTPNVETTIQSHSLTVPSSTTLVSLGRVAAQTTTWDYHLNQCIQQDTNRVCDVVGFTGSWNGVTISSGHTGGGIRESVWGQGVVVHGLGGPKTISQIYEPHIDSGDGSTILISDQALVTFGIEVGISVSGTAVGDSNLSGNSGIIRGAQSNLSSTSGVSGGLRSSYIVGGSISAMGWPLFGSLARTILEGGSVDGASGSTANNTCLRGIEADLAVLSSGQADAAILLGLGGASRDTASLNATLFSFVSGSLTPHHVWNELDYHGVLMGLVRLDLEKNAEYKRRLLDVMVHRANSTYRGLIYGITRELGLQLSDAMRITMTLDEEGNPILPCPAIVFQDTKVSLYDDYYNNSKVAEFDRWTSSGGVYTLEELVQQINQIEHFQATLDEDIDPILRSMTCFNQSSIKVVTAEDIGSSGPRIQLANKHILDGTFSASSDNLKRRVSNETNITQEGDYYVDLTNGMLYASTAPSPGSTARYQCAVYDITVQSSPVVINNLQSSDFSTKMFNGLPTPLGSSIVNELLSIYPSTWGK